MTRENKLALIVGFGLILLVGILVSDYFSDAQRQRQDNLGGIIDPLSDERQSDGSIQYKPALEGDLLKRTLQPASNTGTKSDLTNGPYKLEGYEPPHAPRTGPSTHDDGRGDRNNRDEIEMGGSDGDAGGDARTTPKRNNWTDHHVRSNENLTSICNRYYKTKDWSVVLKLAAFNGMDDPNAIREGRRLRIPHSLADLQSSSASGNDGASPADTRSNNRSAQDRGNAPTQTYTVKSGDTLSGIASATMGSAGKWQELLEFNKDVIDDPDTVLPGTVLRIPST